MQLPENTIWLAWPLPLTRLTLQPNNITRTFVSFSIAALQHQSPLCAILWRAWPNMVSPKAQSWFICQEYASSRFLMACKSLLSTRCLAYIKYSGKFKLRKTRKGNPNAPACPLLLWSWGGWSCIGSHSFNSVILWAAAVVTLHDPNTHLSYLAIDDPTSPLIISLFIKQSKMDQKRAVVKVVIGKTGDDFCPVLALLGYLQLHGSAPGALFLWQD